MILEPSLPYTRQLKGQPLLILTTPRRQALCITADGHIGPRGLTGVVAGTRLGAPKPTQAQLDALRQIACLSIEWQAYLDTATADG